MIDLQVRNWRGQEYSLLIDTVPDSCPLCHRAIEPVDLEWDFLADQPSPNVIERVLRCPKKDCQRLFIARYSQYPPHSNVFELVGCVPVELQTFEFPVEIREISSDFCDIYAQAHKAEQLGLLLVAGPGYRKALEFLIKDYVLRLQPDATSEIEKMTLGACIKKYVTDPRMKTTAERAVWLGNDETHWVRKWEDKDLDDMKKFIRLTCYWIQSEHLTNNAPIEMPERKH